MKSSTLLDSALFQLTPTRTRCELVISANGKEEKLASGLLNPFLAHLKTAQEQVAKGGYSIILEPEPGDDATWFTKNTMERFVRFVSTPEVLERVYTIESEILQIEEAIAIQGNNDMGINTVEDYQKPVESTEGSRLMPDTSEEKAIVLYKPGAHPPEANGSTTQEGNSKVQLLKVLETRKTMLQKEQGMAFARAVAAGFDIDHMLPLISFAECFGASRLMDACTKFLELWKRKHETGQWLEIEAAEAMSSRSDFSAMNASGIMLANVASENNGKASSATSADEKPSTDQQPPLGHQEYFQGQYPHHMFPPWPVHSPPGAPPVFQAYPMQGMPYYQNYPGNSPYFQPPYPSVSDPRLNVGQRMRHRRHSMDSRDSNIESEILEMDASKTRSKDDVELDKEASQTRESWKKTSQSGKKQSGTVVIRNINYITSKRQNSSGSESQSASESETDEEGGDLQADTLETRHMNSQRSSKRKGSHTKSIDKSNLSDKEEMVHGKDTDGGHWQAFQNYLLRDADEDKRVVDQGMFAMEKGVKVKRRQSNVGNDPLAFTGQEKGEIQEGDMIDMHKISGSVTYMPKASNDELLISRREGQSADGRSADVSTETDGRRGSYKRTSNDDFMIHRRESQAGYTSSPSDPLALNRFDRVTNNLDRSSSHDMDDDSYIVALRENSLDQVGNNNRNAINMESEFPSALQKEENLSNRVGSQVNYEPDELSLMPERGTEKGSIGYDPALDYEMQIRAEEGASQNKKNTEVKTDIKQGSKKADKDRKSKLTPDTSKTVGPIRKGKPSKLSPLDEARARAERLRTYKADLQKMKKEKEEEEMKRLEALKIERQKRIAARGGSTLAQSPLPSLQNKKQLPTKLSPSSHKGSKFSDSEAGSSSPLQRLPIRTTSVGSSDSQKASKPSKLNTGSHSAGNKLSRSVPSLPEPKKEGNVVIADTKASMARIRRLSEPKMGSSHHVSSVKPRSAEPVSKTKISDGPESKKISAIVNYDRTKAATLPELKIKSSKGPDAGRTKSAGKEMTQKVIGNKSSTTSEGTELKRNHDDISHNNDGDDNPVIEKTVVMLECEKPSIPTVHALEARKGQYDNFEIGEKTEVVSDYAAIRAPVSPLAMDRVDREPFEHQSQVQSSSYEVMTGNAGKEPPKFSSFTDKPYQAPYAWVSSLEDPCTGNSEYGKAPPTSLETATTGMETVKALVSDSRNLKLEKIPESSEKPQGKDSSKGFRRLLKFGRKNHSSSTGERNVESDDVSLNGSEADDSGTNSASTSEVHTLKNLISQDETPTAGTTQQKSRSFSLLSPFRSKSSEKKLTT